MKSPIHRFRASLAGQTIEIITRRSLPQWDEITPAEVLLAEHADPRGPTLLMGCHHGALAVILARRAPLDFTDETITALETTSQTLAANDLPPSPQPAPTYAAAVIQLPKGRKLARAWLCEAYARLQPHGVVYLAGANEDGIQAVLKDAAALFGSGTILGYKKGHRVGKLIKTEGILTPGWARQPGVAPGSWAEYTVTLRGLPPILIRSRAGVFAFDRLDDGSARLLEAIQTPAGGRVLDFGCGCGILGIAASLKGAGSVTLVDHSLAAIAATQENLRGNRIVHACAIASDGLESLMDAEAFDLILSNPPFHRGQTVDTDASETFLREAWGLLRPGGRILLVANRFIRYDKQLPGRVEILAADNRYHVLQTTKETA